MVLPPPVTMFNTPSGIPAFFANSASSNVANGVSVVGFKTTVFPAIKAGPNFRAASARGKFHAVIATTTPRGILCIKMCSSTLSEGTIFPSICLAQSQAYSMNEHVTSTSILATFRSFPCSCTKSSANRSLFSLIQATNSLKYSALFLGGVLAHFLNDD